MNESTHRPTIVYIASSWRSGSTLLDRVLGTSPNAFGVGELKSLERLIREGYGRDDQGQTAVESPIWSHFAHDIDRYVPPAEQLKMRFSWPERFYVLLTGKVKHVPLRFYNEPLYNDIQRYAREVTGKPVTHIIDSSKPLYRLAELHQRTDFNLFVIHLVRDVRGVVYSHRKQFTKVTTYKAIRNWLLTNIGLSRYLKKSFPQAQQLRLQYEDFIANPEHWATLINERTGLQVDFAQLVERINNEPSYRFSGNDTRKKAFTGFYQNDSWKQKLSLAERVFLAPFNWLV